MRAKVDLQIYSTVDKKLLDGCRRHDRHAQRFLYDHFSPRMLAVCARDVKDRMEAEDVMVVAFTKVFERIRQYKGDGSFEGWIRRVMVNESLSFLRRNKSMYLETEIGAADREPDYERLESAMEAEDLMKLISELPAGYRIVFNLYAIDGYSHQEIAAQLGISENTSKSQLSRARAHLQRSLLKLDRSMLETEQGHEHSGQAIQG
jgi:RNA polymerase sigma factor (sigma-70 family)